MLLLPWRVRSNAVLVVRLVRFAGKALTASYTHTHQHPPLPHNIPHTLLVIASTPPTIRNASANNMAPKRKTAAEKALNRSAGAAKRMATMAAKKRAAAEAANNSNNAANPPHAPETPVPTSNAAGKRPAVDEPDAPPPRRRHRLSIEDSTPPLNIPSDPDEESEYSELPEGEMVSPSFPEPTLGPKKTVSKTKTGGKSKQAERVRAVAVAGPRLKIPKSKGTKAQLAAEATIERSLDVNLEDRQIVANARLIWEVCERSATYIAQGEDTLPLRFGYADVLTYIYRSHLHRQEL